MPWHGRHRRATALAVALLLAAAVTGCGARAVAPASTPSPLASRFTSATAVFDPDHRELLFLGLVLTPGGPHEETWAWVGDGWQELLPAHEPSPPRETLLMQDPATHQVLVQGGSYSPPPAPATRTSCGAATCSTGTAHTAEFFQDTWLWNGSDWMEQAATSGPDHVVAGSAVFSTARGELVAGFAGPHPAATGVYAWDGSTWTQLTHSDDASGFSIALDPASGQVIGYGGRKGGCVPDPCVAATSTTIAGDGVTWSRLAVAEPEAQPGTLVADPANHGVLLLNQARHTWVFSDGTWHEAALSGPDTAVPAFLYSDGLGVYFQPQPGLQSPRWSWDGQRWSRL